VKRAKGKYKQEKEAKQQSEQDLKKIKRSIRAYEALEQARAGAPLETVLAPAFTGEVDDGHAQGEGPSSPEVERAETLARIAANKAQEEREQQSKESAESARRNGYETAWSEAKKGGMARVGSRQKDEEGRLFCDAWRRAGQEGGRMA